MNSIHLMKGIFVEKETVIFDGQVLETYVLLAMETCAGELEIFDATVEQEKVTYKLVTYVVSGLVICASKEGGIHAMQVIEIYAAKEMEIYVAQENGICVAQVNGICVVQVNGICVVQVNGICVVQVNGIYAIQVVTCVEIYVAQELVICVALENAIYAA